MNQEISGADPCPQPVFVDKQETNTACRLNFEWVRAKTRGRWALYWNAKTKRFEPPSSPARDKARRQKRAWAKLDVPLELCLTGDELLAERPRVRGDGTSFRRTPATQEACELVALIPHGRLRVVEARIMLAIGYAMFERRRHGLVATMDELGEFVGLRKSAMGEACARLIALGFVRADATFTRYGKCESQRANIWRLTTQAAAAFMLCDLPPGIALPTGTVDRARLQRRRTYSVGSRACATSRNPDAIPDSLSDSGEKPESFRNGPRIDEPQKIDGPATPAHRVCSVPDGSPVRAVRETRQGATRGAPPEAVRERGSTTVLETARRRAALASDDFSPDTFAALVDSPALRSAILDAKRARRTLDDSEMRFSLLEIDGEPKNGGAS